MSPLHEPDRPRAPRLTAQPLDGLGGPTPPLTHEQAVENFHVWAGRAANDYGEQRTARLLATATLAQAWATYAQVAFFSQPELVERTEHAGDQVVGGPGSGMTFAGREHTGVFRGGQLVALRFPTPKGEVELPSTLTGEEVDLILAAVETVLTR